MKLKCFGNCFLIDTKVEFNFIDCLMKPHNRRDWSSRRPTLTLTVWTPLHSPLIIEARDSYRSFRATQRLEMGIRGEQLEDYQERGEINSPAPRVSVSQLYFCKSTSSRQLHVLFRTEMLIIGIKNTKWSLAGYNYRHLELRHSCNVFCLTSSLQLTGLALLLSLFWKLAPHCIEFIIRWRESRDKNPINKQVVGKDIVLNYNRSVKCHNQSLNCDINSPTVSFWPCVAGLEILVDFLIHSVT